MAWTDPPPLSPLARSVRARGARMGGQEDSPHGVDWSSAPSPLAHAARQGRV